MWSKIKEFRVTTSLNSSPSYENILSIVPLRNGWTRTFVSSFSLPGLRCFKISFFAHSALKPINPYPMLRHTAIWQRLGQHNMTSND